MEHIPPAVARRYQSSLQAALTRWEAHPEAEVPALRGAVAEARTALQVWEAAGLYPIHEARMLRDLTRHVDARLELAAQVRTRGY